MQKVFVLDTNKTPLTPCRPKRARVLLKQGKAAVFRMFPFTIILKYEIQGASPRSIRIKIDTGSRKTGIAIVSEQIVSKQIIANPHVINSIGEVVFAAEIEHRGQAIKDNLESRRAIRRGRRNRNTRYRQAKFLNRTRPKGWMPPSEHIQPKSKGGSDRISNLTLACRARNEKKNNKPIEEFLKGKPEILKRILAQAKTPLKDASAVNATRWALLDRLKVIGLSNKHKTLSVETGSGGLTKFNRVKRNLPKAHWIDAACVGQSTPKVLKTNGIKPLEIKAMGHGKRLMCRVDKYGFPRTSAKSQKRVKGFQTGDMVKAVVTKGKKIGVYIGHIAVRISGYFNITTGHGVVQGIRYKSCVNLHECDGYNYIIS